MDGNVRAPDDTITVGVAGSGAGRLLITPAEEMYRVRVQAQSSDDDVPPAGVTELETVFENPTSVDLAFVSTGDDGTEGRPASYEVRYIAGAELTEENWSDATVADVLLDAVEPGMTLSFSIEGLLPNTNYSVGVRATDECLNQGPVVSTFALTPRFAPGTVDACFVATAAYGSLMANEVVALRTFRDRFLRSNVPGELAVESYYTFGPAVAKLIQGSPLLRRTARAALGPAVERASGLIR